MKIIVAYLAMVIKTRAIVTASIAKVNFTAIIVRRGGEKVESVVRVGFVLQL
ncbi:hypothetical protein CCACVL1_02343 [Corchorus capsularis]|uniref:Uncharacterized protein n=1 Tax=Corchorus capsularis TaxID=210143 RepID=A0A1R3K936_COCAP|nr:hypothetical protein CCACVL1_02343 [Corchorus capsularis]